MPYYINPPPQSPLARIVATIIAVFAVAGAFMIGVFALAVVAVVGLIAGVAIWLRVAWIRRHLPKRNVGEDTPTPTRQVLEAEYTVISEHENQE